jgi:SAM-dependent methyltransferase
MIARASLGVHCPPATAQRALSAGGVQGGDGETVKVLDLGAGKGGAARWLAKTYRCHVTCFNLGAKQNEFNKAKATVDGIGELIDTHLGSFNEPLPMDWTDAFDLVWSQEAFCHCMDHGALMAEVQRVLKPGGTVVFSDIMQGDNGGDCSSFTGQNVTTKLASPQTYKVRLRLRGPCFASTLSLARIAL